jgi:uncharacterized membrane protein/predicted DsbA family dithiol-disulfide isomerase
LLAGAGCFICGVLVHLGTPSDGPHTILGAAVCAPTDTVNCDYVLNSRWAKIGPIPTSVLGLTYFAALGAWFAIIGVPNYAGRRWHVLPLAVVIPGVCGSIGFLYVLWFELPVSCPWCIAAHVVNLSILVLAIAAWPRRAGVRALAAVEAAYPSGARAATVLGFSIAAAWIAIATVSSYNAQVYASRLQAEYQGVVNNADYIAWRHAQSPLRQIPIHAEDLSIGPPEAPHTLVVFTDFQCSNCRAFHSFAARLSAGFPERLRLVLKHCPMSAECNEHVSGAFHYFSCEAARAAEAARAVGNSDQTHKYYAELFDNMERFAQKPYASLAVEVGLDRSRFLAALKAGAGVERIEADTTLANELGVEGTPALFLDGRRLRQWRIVKPGTRADVDWQATGALWVRLLGRTRDAAQDQSK